MSNFDDMSALAEICCEKHRYTWREAVSPLVHAALRCSAWTHWTPQRMQLGPSLGLATRWRSIEMKEAKTTVLRMSLLGSCLALLSAAPQACVIYETAPSDDDDPVIVCDAAPQECMAMECVGSWADQCVVQGDICVPALEHGASDPSKCFIGECYCAQAGCAWDGAQCAPDAGCPAVPPPTVPTDPSPYEGCDPCTNSAWQPQDGITLKWDEPAEQYLQYEIEVHRNPHLQDICLSEPDWASERVTGTTYDVYFGTEPDPPLLQAGIPTTEQELPGFVTVKGDPHYIEMSAEVGGPLLQSAEFHVAGPLATETVYFWRVVVRNQAGETASGPIWQFKTIGPSEPTTCPGMPTVSDGEGHSYETAQIGSQCWMKTPLKLGDVCEGYYTCQQDNGNVEKSCQQSGSDCTGHYTWNELMNYSGAGSICPAGWSVPSVSEWQALFSHPDAGRLSPSYGGYIEYSNVSGGAGATAYMWSSTQKTSGLEGTANVAVISHPSKSISPTISSFNKGYRMTAYCLKD
jgi:hypothetical protein